MEHDRVPRDSATIMAATVAGLIVMGAADLALAYRFGLSRNTDILIVALVVPLAVDAVLREASRFSLVPLLVERIAAGTRSEFVSFFSGLVNLALIPAAALVAALEIGRHLLAGAIAPGFASEELALLEHLLSISLPLIGVSALSSVLVAALQAHQRFFVPAMRQAVLGVTVLAAIYLSRGPGSRDALPLVVASYGLGYVLYFALLLASVARLRLGYTLRCWLNAGERRIIGNRLSWILLTFALSQLMRVAERSIATVLMPGGVTAYHLAFRLYTAAQQLMAWSLSTASLSSLAHSAVTEARQAFARRVRRLAAQGLALTIPVALIFAVAAGSIAALIADLAGAAPGLQEEFAASLRALAVALPLGTLGILLTTGVYALGRPRQVLGYAASAVAVDLALALVLAPVIGISALGWALAAATAVICIGAVRSLGHAGARL